MQMIVRLDAISDDIEIMYQNPEEELVEKKLSKEKFLEICDTKFNKVDESKATKPKWIEPYVLAYSGMGNKEVYLINQPEHKRYVTYSISNKTGGCLINFPNSLYWVTVNKNEIVKITAYMYLKYESKDTVLYKYAMANMIGNTDVCIGNADRNIESKDILQALENIIYAPYSHNYLNNVKGFSNTESYFEYLKNNTIKQKHLYPENKKIMDIVS